MIAAWLMRHPALAIAAVGYLVLGGLLGVRTWQLRSAEATVVHQVEVIASLRASVELQNAAVEHARTAAEAARRRSLAALEEARSASATRQPAIAALTAAERAGGALTCGDAVERVRDALGR